MPRTYQRSINLIHESGESPLATSLFRSCDPISALFIDSYFLTSDNELPTTAKNYIIGFILEKESSHETSSNLLSRIKSESLILRCLDEKVDSFYYIIYSDFLAEMKFLIIKYPFSMLEPNLGALQSFVSLRPEEISFQFNYFSYVSSMNKSLMEWMSYSSNQKTQTLILSQELKELKDSSTKQSNKSNKPFGLCIFCYERCRNIVFLPCGHMAACLQCSVRKLKVEITQEDQTLNSSSKCPLCNQKIQQSIEVLS